jgi:MFS family permease
MTRTERTYYLVFALYNLSWSFLGPMYALFLLHRGLDLFQINVVLATYLITAFLFEVPTGAVADLFGRKISFILSCVVRMFAFALYAYSDTFPQFLLAEFIDAVGTTLASGALDAWAVDGMRAEGDRRATDRFFARAQMLARTLMIASGLVSGYVADHNITWPWLISAGGFALTAVCGAAFMREDRLPTQQRGSHASRVRQSLTVAVRDGLGTVHRTPVLRMLCLLTLVTAFATMPAHMLWQPRLQALAGGGIWIMGWVWAFLNLGTIIGSALIPRLLARFRREVVLSVASVWRGVTLGFGALATGFRPATAGFLLQEIGFGLSEPSLQAWMNEHVSESQRATVLSVRAMAFTLGGAAGLVCLGLLARAYGVPVAWFVSALVFALVSPGFFLIGRSDRRSRHALEPTAGEAVPAKVLPAGTG